MYVRAAVGHPLADLCRPVDGTVRFVAAQHVTGGDGCLRQVAVGGMGAAHRPFVEHKPGEMK